MLWPYTKINCNLRPNGKMPHYTNYHKPEMCLEICQLSVHFGGVSGRAVCVCEMMLAEKAAAHYATKVDKLQAPVTNYTHSDTQTHRQASTNDRKSVGSEEGRFLFRFSYRFDCDSDTKLFIHLDILHVRLRYILHRARGVANCGRLDLR